LLIAFSSVTAATAEDSDLAAGEKLYVSQCKICHGNVTATQTGHRFPDFAQGMLARAVTQPWGGTTMSDAPPQITVRSSAGPAAGLPVAEGVAWPERLAFAPPFGPNLRGVYGRPAGTVKGYDYSSTLLATIKGMEWNDAALDVWITNPQAWVPGVYMFYKQPDPEVRRKIILYLKANP
jgi:cytochrome c2